LPAVDKGVQCPVRFDLGGSFGTRYVEFLSGAILDRPKPEKVKRALEFRQRYLGIIDITKGICVKFRITNI
jgi:hypothetical protein